MSKAEHLSKILRPGNYCPLDGTKGTEALDDLAYLITNQNTKEYQAQNWKLVEHVATHDVYMECCTKGVINVLKTASKSTIFSGSNREKCKNWINEKNCFC